MSLMIIHIISYELCLNIKFSILHTRVALWVVHAISMYDMREQNRLGQIPSMPPDTLGLLLT